MKEGKQIKKIPTLFKREFENHKVVKVLPELSDESLSWVLDGEGIATEKIDGACCAVIDGKLYKRYDAKKDKHGNLKVPPAGAIPCDEPDPVTGHWPHWVLVDENDPADQWFVSAYTISSAYYPDGTYEAVGLHFNGNPHCLHRDYLIPHGNTIIDLPDRSFKSIRSYLADHAIEGIVFWNHGQPQCKIKRSDFGLPWPDKERLPNLDHYVYEMEMPAEYAAVFASIAESANLTVEDLIEQYLRHTVSHPEDLLKWKADFDALSESESREYSRIEVKEIKPVYSDGFWLEQHSGGTK